MRFLVLLMLCVVLFPFAGMAADNSAPLPDVLQPQAPPPVYDTRQSLLDKHYAECLPSQSGLFDQKNTDLLCACLVAQVDQLFPDERDLRRYVLRERGWVPLKDTMLMQVYPDCMAAALGRVTHDECVASFSTQESFQKGAEICRCVGDGFQDFLLDRASGFTSYYLERTPKGSAPYDDFIKGYGMEVQNKYLMTTCIQRHEYGWK